MTAMNQRRYEGFHKTFMTCQVEIEHPREISCELQKLNGIQLEFGEGGRLGKGGHMENLDHTP